MFARALLRLQPGFKSRRCCAPLARALEGTYEGRAARRPLREGAAHQAPQLELQEVRALAAQGLGPE